MAVSLKELDRLITGFYAATLELDSLGFRPRALELLCRSCQARGGVWMTRSQAARSGEFTEWPNAAGIDAGWLLQLNQAAGPHEQWVAQLPKPFSEESGLLLRYSHRSSPLLTSVVLLRAPQVEPAELEGLRRATGHMVEASSLALQQVVQRDEWLRALGRPSRGAAALVDGDGIVHAASDRFRDLLQNEFGDRSLQRLPFRLPLSVLEEQGACNVGALHLRIARHDNLYILHARPPVPLDTLSPREQEIARALAEGKTFKTVARQLDIAVSTVANHASRIYRKLGIFRREELVGLLQSSKQTPKQSSKAA